MKKELINEILTFKLLSKYETKNTFTENVNVMIEQKGALKSLIKNIEPELAAILKKTGPLGPGGTLKTVDDVIFALKTKSLTPINKGKLYAEILKSSKNRSLKEAAAELIVNQKSFIDNLSSGTAAERLFKIKSKNPNLSDEVVRTLHKANEKRILRSIKQTRKTLKPPKPSPNQIINNNYIFPNPTLIDDYVRNYKGNIDDFAKQNGHSSMSNWMKNDPSDVYRVVSSEGKSGKGIFSKLINWGGRVIKMRTLWGLAKIAGVSWLVWWAFFKEDGFKIQCEPGEHEENDRCVADKKTDDAKFEGRTKSDTIVDSEGNQYQECEAPYYKGCVNKKGNSDIKKVQDCLGVTPNGFFNKETEDALYNKINKKSFSPSDISTICAKQYGGLGEV
jgi:hypothetical protein